MNKDVVLIGGLILMVIIMGTMMFGISISNNNGNSKNVCKDMSKLGYNVSFESTKDPGVSSWYKDCYYKGIVVDEEILNIIKAKEILGDDLI